ncbi:hypothetical protein ACJX0J_026757, partial [Zea mays]
KLDIGDDDISENIEADQLMMQRKIRQVIILQQVAIVIANSSSAQKQFKQFAYEKTILVHNILNLAQTCRANACFHHLIFIAAEKCIKHPL